MTLKQAESLVKSKQRVADHGEVFTPSWLVDEMINLVGQECERIDSRVLEPACGSGNFLAPILLRKFSTVQARHGHSAFEKNHHALLALMSIYGIELLADNAGECRDNLGEVFNRFVDVAPQDEWAQAARSILAVNIVQGNALTLTTPSGTEIVFPEWGYLGRGRFQRRDFRYASLTQRSSFGGTLFGEMDQNDIFTPTKTYPVMTFKHIAALENR